MTERFAVRHPIPVLRPGVSNEDMGDAMKIFLTGHIHVPDDKLSIVRSALPEHVALTLAEKGCISFEVVEDDAIRGCFWVSETFENQAAFDAHQTRTLKTEWFRITADFPREYEISVGSPVKAK